MAGRDGAVRPRKERTENANRRRAQIIDATFRSIIRNGLSGTTLASVAQEAGLSQGVAVFYFQNKPALLAEALRRQYEIYQQTWQRALAAAGPDPAAQIIALVRSDFAPEVCNDETLIVWHAFWGESTARPLYGEISTSFEAARAEAMRRACAALLRIEGRPDAAADDIATGIDAMTDGIWQAMYLKNRPADRARPMRLACMYLGSAFPDHADRFAAGFGVKPPLR